MLIYHSSQLTVDRFSSCALVANTTEKVYTLSLSLWARDSWCLFSVERFTLSYLCVASLMSSAYRAERETLAQLESRAKDRLTEKLNANGLNIYFRCCEKEII